MDTQTSSGETTGHSKRTVLLSLALAALLCASTLAGCSSTTTEDDPVGTTAQTGGTTAQTGGVGARDFGGPGDMDPDQMAEAMKDRLQEMVDSGDITQEQADAFTEWLAEMPDRDSEDFPEWMESQPDLGDIDLGTWGGGRMGQPGQPGEPGQMDIESALQPLVDNGDISQEQADEYVEWWEAMPTPDDSGFEDWLAARPDMGDVDMGPIMKMPGTKPGA